MRNWADAEGLLHSVVNGVLDLVYPPKCLVCDAMQPRYLCPECVEKIHFLGPYFCCYRCGAPVEEGYCSECRGRELYFDGVRSVGTYEDPLREAIHQLKFSGHSVLAPELAELMVKFYMEQPAYYGIGSMDLLLPIPIDRARQRERGFNQSQLLARPVAAAARKPLLTNVLVRSRRTPPQSSLSYDERLVNLQGAFAVARPDAAVGRKILLIDDVYTTGSTANEAARVLKEAGAAEVYVFTLARSL